MVSTIKNGIVASRLEAISQKWPHDFMNGWSYYSNNVLMNVHNSLPLARDELENRIFSRKRSLTFRSSKVVKTYKHNDVPKKVRKLLVNQFRSFINNYALVVTIQK